MDKTFFVERKTAIKDIATATDAIKQNIKLIEKLADQYGIRVELDLPATGYNGDCWYVPRPPAEMCDDTLDENFDPSGTDWMWESSAEEQFYDYSGEGPFGWKNSSSSC